MHNIRLAASTYSVLVGGRSMHPPFINHRGIFGWLHLQRLADRLCILPLLITVYPAGRIYLSLQ